MSRIGIVGPSECGKSHLAKCLSRVHMRAGRPSLVCDPLGDKWPAKWVTTEAAALIAKAKALKNCTLFIDESGLAFDRDDAFKWLFVTSRHSGHVVHVMAQDYTQLLPAWRKMLTKLYLFSCHPDEAAIWARVFPKCAAQIEELAPALNQYEFLEIEKFPTAPLRPLKIAA